mmetsp:Transcript_69992/g.186520  ORF Transcript_69992/g.186520 Transcript_69992/m.186520 type:complete len:253 (-) Transcript_69992:239-997(-)
MRLPNVGEEGRDAELGGVDDSDADPLGRVRAELRGKGLDAQLAVALHGLEVVDDGDAEARNRVGEREGHRLPGEGGGVEEALAAPPGQRHVRHAQRVVAHPPNALELERRGGVEVADEGAQHRHAEDDGRGVPCPGVQRQRQPQARQQQEPDLLHHLPLADGPRRDRPVGLVDGVDVAVTQVVERLSVTGEQRARQEGACKGLDQVHPPLVKRRPVPDGVIVARGGGATHHAPYEGYPRDGLGELQPQCPFV